jgi:hypothetical protein
MYYGQEESIYQIIPPKYVPPEKPPMYRSSHKGAIPPTATTFGLAQTSLPGVANIDGGAGDKIVPDKGARTFGQAPGSYQPDPTAYMKKAAKNKPVPSLSEVKKGAPDLLQPTKLKMKHKPGLPAKDETPIMNLVSSKNFVVANAVETILAAPKKVSQGAKDYLHKEDYGRTPQYLSKIKGDIEAEYEYIRQLQAEEEEARKSQVRVLTAEEKDGLITGLKARWEQVNTDYQATTHLTKLDTIGKVKRKEKYEAELSQIEKDIEKLNRKYIFVDTLS